VELPAASRPAQELVTRLLQLGSGNGTVTVEQAAAWKQSFQELVGQGAVAAPAILQFMDRNVDLSFTGLEGGAALGSSSVRMALIDALRQIGGPETTTASLQVLHASAVPEEIEALGRNLEQQAPGQFRQEILAAARETLNMAVATETGDRDVGSLFRTFQLFGDASAAAELEEQLPRWQYYATMALAELPEGQGIPALLHEMQDPRYSPRIDFAFQMLAQVSTQFPEAASALLDLAQRNQIPEAAWRKIAIGLTTDQRIMGGGAPDTGIVPGLKTFHIAAGNQNFSSLPLAAVIAEDEIEKRRAFISQLLAVNTNPTAVQALVQARAALSGDTSAN